MIQNNLLEVVLPSYLDRRCKQELQLWRRKLLMQIFSEQRCSASCGFGLASLAADQSL